LHSCPNRRILESDQTSVDTRIYPTKFSKFGRLCRQNAVAFVGYDSYCRQRTDEQMNTGGGMADARDRAGPSITAQLLWEEAVDEENEEFCNAMGYTTDLGYKGDAGEGTHRMTAQITVGDDRSGGIKVCALPLRKNKQNRLCVARRGNHTVSLDQAVGES
jgi:hypothetical protein